MFDLDAYVERIGTGRDASVAEVHRAHMLAIPFENLDPHRGVPVSLEPDALAAKLVAARRGGYCFEQNLLLKAGLEALGAEVEMMLARVRSGAPPGSLRPRSHLVLRVRDGGKPLLADVGFGLGTLLEPIPFEPGGPYEQWGWRYRLVAEGRELVLQSADEGTWRDVYAFVPEPVPLVDVETSNWFTCTYPRSPFVTGLIVAAQQADGSQVSLSDWSGTVLTKLTPTESKVTPVAREAVPELLERVFDLPGFALAQDGKVVPAAEVREPAIQS
jgi:N-hydroxyarylamine O-acetyltransferase